jgi:superfamily II DNA or RNA helicase
MRIPITQKMLVDWAGPAIFRDGQILYQNGLVQEAQFDSPYLRGVILRAGRAMKTGARLLPNGVVENLCPCRDSTERGIVCSHVIAVGLALIHRSHDPLAEARRQEEHRRAARIARLAENAFLPRVPEEDPSGLPVKLVIRLGEEWRKGWEEDAIPLTIEFEREGSRWPSESLPRDRPLALSPSDENLLFVLEDIVGGTPPHEIRLSRTDFFNVLTLWTGRLLTTTAGDPIGEVDGHRLATRLQANWLAESGEIELRLRIAAAPDDVAPPHFFVVGSQGWVLWKRHFHPLERVLPGPLQDVYRGPIRIPHDAVPRFLQSEWPLLTRLMPAECDIALDWFRFEPAEPRFHLTIRGSPASLAFHLTAEYNGHTFIAGRETPSEQVYLPDPSDLFRFFVRNLPREHKALATLRHYGIRGDTGDALSPIIGEREVLNVLGGRLPALRRLGWTVTLEGRVAPYFDRLSFVHPVVRVHESADRSWFEIGFDYETHEGPVSMAEIHRALLKGESFLRRGDRVILLDSDAIESLNRVFRDCSSEEGERPGTFRLRAEYTGYVKASLDALDGVDVEASPGWRDRAERQVGRVQVATVTVPRLRVALRPYQAEGVNWLRFLESAGFHGILADEMGLGKTLQTLAWISLPRLRSELQGRPALVVCPTSLVENWAEEAARFISDLRVLSLTGNERHALWDRIGEAELVITSYALLRRDVERYRHIPFSIVVLDEAQHIKNRSTLNAITAKMLQAGHRLVLTGTPIENSVSDLWSIMDFLMPGYLGTHETFRRHYEAPLAAGGFDAEEAQLRLRRKLAPFLLRRLKRDVARELPPKIERTAYCTPTPLQKQVYRALVETSRHRLETLVAERGFRACAFEVLKTLLQLRQASCHLDLLHWPDLPEEGRSAKLDLFFELLDEALDGGHRLLVFSQFVSMLSILRHELDARSIPYAYLDGSTRERQAEVHRFNADRSIPLFLISLKAGGFGLNLTGADMVIHFDPWWNPAVEQQATDRAYRIGQTRHVYSIKLIARGTVEEKVLEMQQRKQAVIDATLDVDQVMLQSLTWEEVRTLMSWEE